MNLCATYMDEVNHEESEDAAREELYNYRERPEMNDMKGPAVGPCQITQVHHVVFLLHNGRRAVTDVLRTEYATESY